MNIETQISGWLLVAIGAFTLAKLEDFFLSFGEDRPSWQVFPITTFLKSPFQIKVACWHSQPTFCLQISVRCLLINSQKITKWHKPLCPVPSHLCNKWSGWKEQLRRFWTTLSHFFGMRPGKTPDRKLVWCPWQRPTRSSKMPKRRHYDIKRETCYKAKGYNCQRQL